MRYSIYGVLLMFFWGCKKPPLPPSVSAKYNNGLVVLCEGLYSGNNASLSFYSFEENKVYNSIFLAENGRGLGDTANDMALFTKDGKDYLIICVDISSQLEIIDLATMKSVVQIPLFDGEFPREPREVSVIHDQSKAFIANFDGTVTVLDLTTFEVKEHLKVGKNPDGIASFGSYTYVVNSGGLDYPVYDSTLTLVLNYGGVGPTFPTRINCSEIIVNNANYIYLRSNGNYGDIPPALLKIYGETGEIEYVSEVNYSSFQIKGDFLYFFDQDSKSIGRLSMITDEKDPSYNIDVSAYETFGGFYLDPVMNQIYTMDLHNYINSSTIHMIDFSGNEKEMFTVGLNANSILKI